MNVAPGMNLGISNELVSSLNFQNVAPGMKLWGVIAEVNERDIAVSLPGGLHGLVRASEASDLIAENEIKVSTCLHLKDLAWVSI